MRTCSILGSWGFKGEEDEGHSRCKSIYIPICLSIYPSIHPSIYIRIASTSGRATIVHPSGIIPPQSKFPPARHPHLSSLLHRGIATYWNLRYPPFSHPIRILRRSGVSDTPRARMPFRCLAEPKIMRDNHTIVTGIIPTTICEHLTFSCGNGMGACLSLGLGFVPGAEPVNHHTQCFSARGFLRPHWVVGLQASNLWEEISGVRGLSYGDPPLF